MFQNDCGLFCVNEGQMGDHVGEQMPEQSTFPPKVSLAMMYVPFQRFENLYDPERALERGTLFQDLDLPFYGGKGGNRRW